MSIGLLSSTLPKCFKNLNRTRGTNAVYYNNMYTTYLFIVGFDFKILLVYLSI